MNVYVLYVLELKKSDQKVCQSVCLSGCLSVCMLGRLENVFGCTITFEGISAFKQNFVGVGITRTSGIEI